MTDLVPTDSSPPLTAAASLTRAPISRRQFLTGGAAVSLGAVLAGHDHQITRLLAELGGTPAGASEALDDALTAPVPSFTFSVDREADLALLDFAFYGFSAVTTGSPQLHNVRITGLQAAATNVITVQFPPQAIGEAAYNYSPKVGTFYVDPPPVLSAMAQPSRLCFTIPDGAIVELPTMSAADLLDWSNWTLLVPAGAQVRAQPAPANPYPPPNPADPTKTDTLADLLTYIEYPYALYLAPTVYVPRPGVPLEGHGFTTTFSGRPDPLESTRDFADCWTAALAQTENAHGAALTAQGAAVWTRDYNGGNFSTGNATPETSIDYTDNLT